MRKVEIEPGYSFENWDVVEELPQRTGHRYFRVRCKECSDENEEELSNLKADKVRCFRCKPVDERAYHALLFRRVGSLGAIALTGEGRGDSALWMCVCARCGKLCVKDAATLRRHQRRGRSFLNCGCYRPPRRFVHGMSQTLDYKAWQSRIYRCENPKAAGYERYGGRGIYVCERWHKFENYFADMGKRPKGHTLERSDNDGPYSPENCRWAPIAEQNRNKSNNRFLSYEGENHVVTDFAARIGMKVREVIRLLDEGCTPEEIAPAAPYYNQHTVNAGSEYREQSEVLI